MPRYSSFVRRQRFAARVALYGSLASIGALAAALWMAGERLGVRGADLSWRDIDWEAREEVALLQRYLRIDTSLETGSVVAGAQFLADELAAMGLEPRLERLGERHANVWALLEGSEPPALVLHNHIDVSPPGELTDWDHPPFAGIVDPPFLYGRGAFDMKSLTVAQLLALRDLARSHRPPRRSVLFLATGAEEVGSELGAEWILRQHPELVGRFWAVLTEGGVVEAVAVDEIKHWGIEFAQKRLARGLACSDRRERLEELRQDLWRQWREARDARLHPAVATFLESYAETRERPGGRAFPARFTEPLDPVRMGRMPMYLRSLFRDELTPYDVEEDPAGGYRLRLALSLLPGSDPQAALERLLPAWMRHGLDATFDPPAGADAASPLDHRVYRELERSLRSAYPNAPVGPHFVAWSVTDSRFFRRLGVPSYGFSPFLFFSTESFRADRVNERVNLPGYVDGVELYRRVVRRLAD